MSDSESHTSTPSLVRWLGPVVLGSAVFASVLLLAMSLGWLNTTMDDERKPLERPAAWSDPNFDPIVAIPGGFEPIINTSIVEAHESQKVQDDELVLGIEMDGHARAYPINMLTGPKREIINDELNGVPIAATW